MNIFRQMNNFKQLTLILLCFAFVPSIVFADPLTYKVEGETVTVVGCDKKTSGDLAIPAKYKGKLVTDIGDNAFWGCRNLTSVTIGNSVTSIGRGAFNGCTSLTSVTIGNSVTLISDFAFVYCMSLKSVAIGNSVTSIGGRAFSGCTSMTSVTIGNSVTSIGTNAFERCSSLRSVTIPKSVTLIRFWAFYLCRSLESVTFEGNAPALGGNVFKMVSENARIFINPGATGFGEIFDGLPVQILKKKVAITSFNSHAAPFSLTFETESDSTYKIEASHDMQKWREIGEVQGTGSSVKFIERRKALFPKQFYRVKLVE